MVSDMPSLNPLQEVNISHILKKYSIIAVKEAENQQRTRRTAPENVKGLNFFAESFSFLVSRLRHFYYDERIHLRDIAVRSLDHPKQIISSTFKLHDTGLKNT
jgi:hypothetical protein